MAKIYVSRRIFEEDIEILQSQGHEVTINDSSRILTKKELIKNIQGCKGLICLLNDHIDAEVLQSNADLKVVSNIAVGYDNIDVEAATKEQVMVTNTPDVLTETTADLTFALLMSAARRIPEADRYSRKDKYQGWELMQPHIGLDVYGKTLGIWGMGRIGKAVAKRGRMGFDMKIIYTDRERSTEIEHRFDAEFVPFEKLLRESDFLTIHVPLTKDTRGTFDYEAFCKMKNEAILVNVARGPIVKETDLAKAIRDKEIKGAAIDTFENEPRVNPELAKIEEFVALAPHIGSASMETRLKMGKMAVQNMIAGLANEEPPNLINKEVFS